MQLHGGASIVLICCLLLSSCATDVKHLSVPPGKAVAVAYNTSLLSLNPLGTSRSSRFEIVDGKTVSSTWKDTEKIVLTPGKHDVQLSCQVLHGPSTATGRQEFNVDFKANRVYLFMPVYPGEACGYSCSCSFKYGVESTQSEH